MWSCGWRKVPATIHRQYRDSTFRRKTGNWCGSTASSSFSRRKAFLRSIGSIGSARSRFRLPWLRDIGLADRNQALIEAARDLNMPAGYSTLVTGRGRELERTFTEFLIAFALSVVFMYMILASLFESITHPFTILLALPLAVPFALFLVVGHRPEPESLFRAGHAGAVRRREEERHSADRSHEHVARLRVFRSWKRSWKETGIGFVPF